LARCHPELAAGPGRTRRVEFEYERHGTLAYFGAYDVHRAQLMGRVEPTTGIAPFTALVDQVMTVEPYASAKRVFWVVDNGSSHAGARSIERLRTAWPTAELVHLPGLRTPLQRHRHPLRLALHPHRPRRAAAPPGRAPTRRGESPGRLNRAG